MCRALTRGEKTARCTGRLNPVLQLFFLLDKPLPGKHGPPSMYDESPAHSNEEGEEGEEGAGQCEGGCDESSASFKAGLK